MSSPHPAESPPEQLSTSDLVRRLTEQTRTLVTDEVALAKAVMTAKAMSVGVGAGLAGAGTVLALACDLRVLSDRATFAFLFTRVGLTGADMGAAHLLPKIVGAGHAAELLLLGDRVDAQECLRIGLANRVVPADELLAAAADLADRLAAGPRVANALTKKLLVDEGYLDLDSAIELEAQAQTLMLRGADHREFYAAWVEKRKPRFGEA
jgi:enoyl-CoA hydratase/carnithine racemase